MPKCRILLMALFVILSGVLCQLTAAQSPFFWDEFDRDDLLGDVSWNVFRGADVELKNGSVSFTPQADNYPGFSPTGVGALKDFTIRTQIRFHDPQGVYGINPWFGLYGRNVSEFVSYWAGPSTDGNLYIGESDAGSNVIRGQRHLFDSSEILSEDLEVEFRIVGDWISTSAWIAGTERPASPILEMRDTTLQEGTVGVILNPSNRLTGFDMRYFALLPGTPGDFDGSLELDANDIDLLNEEIRRGGSNRVFDLNDDALVDGSDREILIHEHFSTYFGDANLDLEFGSQDLVNVFLAGRYEDGVPNNATWETGDWNGDAESDTSDMVLAFLDGGYEQGPRAAVSSVPEPSSLFLAIVALIITLGGQKRSAGLNASVRV